MKKQIFIFLIISTLFSCNVKNDFAGIVSIPVSGWQAGKVLEYPIEIKEKGNTLDFIYQVQYDPEFSWENIWLNYQLTGPGGDTLIRSTDNLFLFEPGSGRPIGSGCKERLYLNAYFLRNVKLRQTGKYHLRVQHFMRTDTLKGIQALGLRLREVSN